MQIFKRHRTLDEIRVLCKQQGVELRTERFDRGSDFVSLHSPNVIVLYDPLFGRFQGTYGAQSFNSNSDMNLDWYQALVHFFYTDEDPK